MRLRAPHEKTQQVTAERKALNVGKAFPENLGLNRKIQRASVRMNSKPQGATHSSRQIQSGVF